MQPAFRRHLILDVSHQLADPATGPMNPPSRDPVLARRELPGALRCAAAHLRERGDFDFFNDEPEIFTTFQLAAVIDGLADRAESGDYSVGRRLWHIFAPTCTWDDAHGDSRLGEDVFRLVDTLFRQQ